ncbi:MAG: VWA domain-containing protein [Myxococcales bacterium]|nr:VWA domain-containing protein [Myxococcales bacterium]
MRLELTEPWFLAFAALALPAWWWARSGAGRVVFSSLAALPTGARSVRVRLAWLPDVMFGLAVVAMAIAAAGPRTGDRNTRIRRDGIAIMMAVDRSSSMMALDLSEEKRELTRLDAVKQVFESFVVGDGVLPGRPDDAIGLVAFAAHADTRSPLTLDHDNLVTAVRQVELVTPGEDGEDGTSIGAGLALSVERLRQSKVPSKVIVLLTDGKQTVFDIDVDKALEEAVAAGIRVYTVGAGTNGVAAVRVDRGFGPELLQVPVEIDEDLLRRIAATTGGEYLRATDASGLRKIYQRIDALERTKIEEIKFLRYHLHYRTFLLVALALIAAAALLRSSVLRRLP